LPSAANPAMIVNFMIRAAFNYDLCESNGTKGYFNGELELSEYRESISKWLAVDISPDKDRTVN
jgi:hypothetical protein